MFCFPPTKVAFRERSRNETIKENKERDSSGDVREISQLNLSSASFFCHKTSALPRILAILLTLLFFLTGEAFSLVVMKWNATALITDDCAPIVDSGVQNFSFSAFQNVRVFPPSPYLYNGQAGVVTDPNGLLCMRARYYNPHLRRFLNADPIGFSGGSNWFAYADGNPISMSDPFGLCAMNCLSGDTYGSGSAPFDYTYQQLSTGGHIALDGLGLAPGIGEPADIIGSLWYAAEGNFTDATIGLAAAIPIAGWFATGAKGLRYADEAYDAGGEMVDVYRVFGGDARAQGFSWTNVDPRTVNNFRDSAGLPSGGASGATNTADFLIQGKVNPADIINSRSALPLDGNVGGLPELIIDPKNIRLNNFSVLNP